MTVLCDRTLSSLTRGVRPIIDLGEQKFLELIQPASVDCPLSGVAYRIRSSAAPRPSERVKEVANNILYSFSLESEKGAFLEVGSSYLIPLEVTLSLPPGYFASFSPKSTTGRLDIFARVLVDGYSFYDKTPYGYHGQVFVEVTPLSFGVRVRRGTCLVQMRVHTDEKVLSARDIELLHAHSGIVRDVEGAPAFFKDMQIVGNSIFCHLDLSSDVVGLEARTRASGIVEYWQNEIYDPRRYFSPVWNEGNGIATLEPDRFYLLRTKEYVSIPSSVAATVEPYDVSAGEFRSHYAGFFDNGFGFEKGIPAVLEVRVRDIPFRVYDGQPICRMTFERSDNLPDAPYGNKRISHYVSRAPSLARVFADRFAAWDKRYWVS